MPSVRLKIKRGIKQIWARDLKAKASFFSKRVTHSSYPRSYSPSNKRHMVDCSLFVDEDDLLKVKFRFRRYTPATCEVERKG